MVEEDQDSEWGLQGTSTALHDESSTYSGVHHQHEYSSRHLYVPIAFVYIAFKIIFPHIINELVTKITHVCF